MTISTLDISLHFHWRYACGYHFSGNMRCIGSVYKILQIVLAKETSILHGIWTKTRVFPHIKLKVEFLPRIFNFFFKVLFPWEKGLEYYACIKHQFVLTTAQHKSKQLCLVKGLTHPQQFDLSWEVSLS